MKKVLDLKLKYTVGLRNNARNFPTKNERSLTTEEMQRRHFLPRKTASFLLKMAEFTVTLRQYGVGVGQSVGDISTFERWVVDK
jgi:hypothetical protein